MSSAAQAQVHDPFVPWTTILVHGPGCRAGTFMESAFIRLLELELLTDRMQVTLAEAAPTAGLLTVEVPSAVCDADAREALVTVRATGGSRDDRSIALGDLTMEARPRAIALAVAEQIRATRSSLEVSRRERPLSGYHLAMVPDAPEPTAPRARTFDLAGFAAWRTFAPAKTSLLGAEIAATFALPGTRLALRGDAAGSWKNFDDVLGTVNLSTYTVGFGAFALAGQNPTFLAGPHVELGLAQVSGDPASGATSNSLSRALATASVIAGARAWLLPDWALLAEIEGGLTVSGLEVHVSDRTLARLRGPWLMARAGIALRP
jgi:hypothetical protein